MRWYTLCWIFFYIDNCVGDKICTWEDDTSSVKKAAVKKLDEASKDFFSCVKYTINFDFSFKESFFLW